jgi:hypothetical protein
MYVGSNPAPYIRIAIDMKLLEKTNYSNVMPSSIFSEMDYYTDARKKASRLFRSLVFQKIETVGSLTTSSLDLREGLCRYFRRRKKATMIHLVTSSGTGKRKSGFI